MLNSNFSKKILLFFILILLAFIVFQLKNFYFREKIILDDFIQNNSLTVQGDYFNIKGSVESVKKLFINDKEYFLDENNEFNGEVFVFDGYNNFLIKSETRSGKNIIKKIIIYKN